MNAPHQTSGRRVNAIAQIDRLVSTTAHDPLHFANGSKATSSRVRSRRKPLRRCFPSKSDLAGAANVAVCTRNSNYCGPYVGGEVDEGPHDIRPWSEQAGVLGRGITLIARLTPSCK